MQREAAKAIEAKGGEVGYGEPQGPEWLQKLVGDKWFRQIIVVHFGPSTTDNDLEYLTALNQLRQLSLGETKITDGGLEHLRGLPQLRGLELGYTEITDAGLEHLKELPRLGALGLTDTKITDAGLEHLKGLNLGFLSLKGTLVTRTGVKRLQTALPGCRISH